MGLHQLDWAILVGYMLLTLGIGVALRKRAGKGLSSYFLSGRSFPWWLAGTSIVATTFAADTPLAVTGFVAKNGIAGNWFWWVTCLSTMTVTFFFARWWRRSRVLTDVEYIELRYSGKSAAALRGFSALYRGLLLNSIKLAWVLLAMAKVMDAVFGFEKETALLISLLVILSYSVMSGFWGVVVTDFFQFFIAMIGTVVFAILAVKHVGGIGGLESGLLAQYGTKGTSDLLAILPPIDSIWMPFFTLIVYFGIMWWADARVEGGAYVAQRLMSTKNEKHATLASLWYNFANIALRPWPWILVALVSLVVFPELKDKEAGFPMMMNVVLPIGFKGLMVTSFFAAFMSTVDTLINWGSSYLINDFYKRFVVRTKSQKHYVIASKVCEVGLLTMGYLVSRKADSIGGMWKLLIAFTAGLGVVYVARWFWWRVNAWSEVAAMVASGVTTIIITKYTNLDFAHQLCVILPISIVSWVSVTLFTKPVSMEKLTKFYERVRPYPFFWKPVLQNISDPALRTCPDSFAQNARSWLWGVIAVYSLLFAIGKWIFWQVNQALMLTASCALMCYLLYLEMRPKKPREEEEVLAEAALTSEPLAETE
ncbi:MAG: sodium:solute symporter family protein [Pseudomonadota bacterium]